jgi:hypothetical protein
MYSAPILMFLGSSDSCKSYPLGEYLILLMCPVFTLEFNCGFLRKDAEGGA